MFRPTFCPNPECSFHNPNRNAPSGAFRFVRIGYYNTKVVGAVPRYRCLSCGKTFGDRTFQLDYYTKRLIAYQSIHQAFSSGQNLSSIARLLECSPMSIQNRLDRLSRNSIIVHQYCLRTIKLREYLTADGYERFDLNHYYPNNINILMGKDSQFIYAVTHVTMRRKRTEKPEQKKRYEKNEEQYKTVKGSFSAAFTSLFSDLPLYWDSSYLSFLKLYTDKHPAYPKALENVPILKAASTNQQFSHLRIPSTLPRTTKNPLFSSNYIDRELTKDIAAYHRQSVCFVRNVSNGLSRFMCYVLYHNYQKPYRITWGVYKYPPHATIAGVPIEPMMTKLQTVYTDRFFITHEPLTSLWEKIWFRKYKTPMKKKKEYLPQYAKIGYTQPSIKN